MNILFVCKYNRFRSKVAEAFFSKNNKNRKNKARSAGVVEGNDIAPEVFEGAKDCNIEIKGKPRGLNADLLQWQDMIIIVANDVPAILFKDNKALGKPVTVWNIEDTKTNNREEMKRIMLKIEEQVNTLIKDLADKTNTYKQ